MNSFSFQCLLLNLFLSFFSWIVTDDMWELPLDRKNGQSRGRGEIGHSQLYTCPGSMTGYPEGAEAETWSGISVPCETPKKKLLLPLLCPSSSGPASCWPQALPTWTQPHHGKLQASVSECKVPSLSSGSIYGGTHKWAQFQVWRGCGRRLVLDLGDGGGKLYHKEMSLLRCHWLSFWLILWPLPSHFSSK